MKRTNQKRGKKSIPETKPQIKKKGEKRKKKLKQKNGHLPISKKKIITEDPISIKREKELKNQKGRG